MIGGGVTSHLDRLHDADVRRSRRSMLAESLLSQVDDLGYIVNTPIQGHTR